MTKSTEGKVGHEDLKVLVGKLEPGMSVKMEDGSFKKIREISRGMFMQPSKLLTYTDGSWSCYLNDEEAVVLGR